MAVTWWQSQRRRFRPGLEELEARRVPTFVPGVTLPTGPHPRGVATADFNGDGKRDIVVTSTTQGTVTVFLGNGDGTFQAPKTSSPGAALGTVAVGDFDGDGKQDLAVVSPSNGVSVFFGNGNGTFGAPSGVQAL